MAIIKGWFVTQTYKEEIRRFSTYTDCLNLSFTYDNVANLFGRYLGPEFTIPIIAVAEIVTAIIAASMPVLRVFLRRGLTRYGHGSRSGLSNSNGERNTHRMVSLSSGGKEDRGAYFENDLEEIRLTNLERT